MKLPKDFDAEEQAKILLEAIKNPIPLQVSFLGIQWGPAPEGSVCPRCEAPLERARGLSLMSPWAGSVRCTKCDFRDSVVGYLGRSMIQVQPMPPGAEPIYLEEPNTDGNLCLHRIAAECHCVCHSGRDLILHDRVCCNPCLKCGFRDVVVLESRHCPECGSGSLETTMVGSLIVPCGESPRNRARCSCGWRGLVGDLISKSNIP